MKLIRKNRSKGMPQELQIQILLFVGIESQLSKQNFSVLRSFLNSYKGSSMKLKHKKSSKLLMTLRHSIFKNSLGVQILIPYYLETCLQKQQHDMLFFYKAVMHCSSSFSSSGSVSSVIHMIFFIILFLGGCEV